MTPTRREFVLGSVVIPHALALPAFAGQSMPGVQGRLSSGHELMFAQFDAQMLRVHRELRGAARRPDSIRALESTTRLMATFLVANGFDDEIRSGLARRIRAVGRAEWVSECLDDERGSRRARLELERRVPTVADVVVRPATSREQAEQALDELLVHGFSRSLIVFADQLRGLAEQLGAQRQLVKFSPARFGPCDEYRIVAETLSAEAAFLGGVAAFIPAMAPVAAEAAFLAVLAWGVYGVCEYWI